MKSSHQPLSLVKILETTQDKMQQLLNVLLKETSLLKDNNMDEIQNITEEKIILTKLIEKNEQLRNNFLAKKSLNPNNPSEWLKGDQLKSLWSKIKSTSEQAQKQNKINGIVINGNHRRAQMQFEILSSSPPMSDQIYSASGQNVKQHRSNTIGLV